MNKVIIAENLSKAYQLGQFSTGYLSRDIQRWWALKRGKEDPFLKIGEANDRTIKGKSDIVWSLKDINFEIERGSAIGIIGKNGAGKSTLLKILSQITSPTNGSVKLKGRVASLLEVGTGFHPELTGRENVFLNGAILGMSKREVLSKFDEIVEFAGVERYIDTPVKRYSSGMYVRLAFAVAAHLESEILIVDEVLAVGDAEFQKKCLGKMGEISKGQGRTILFVSHNMASISQLCNEALLLDNGELVYRDQATKVVQKYMATNISDCAIYEVPNDKLVEKKQIKIEKIWISGSDNNPRRKFMLGESITFNYQLKNNSTLRVNDIMLAIQLTASDGVKVCNMIDKDSNFKINIFESTILVSVTINELIFYEDVYNISFWVGTALQSKTIDIVEDKLSFEIIGGGNKTTRSLPRSSGMVFLTPDWNIKNI